MVQLRVTCDSGLMFGFTRLLYPSWLAFTDCLMFGAIISATDPGRRLVMHYTYALVHFSALRQSAWQIDSPTLVQKLK